jgi:hypothetical protein
MMATQISLTERTCFFLHKRDALLEIGKAKENKLKYWKQRQADCTYKE